MNDKKINPVQVWKQMEDLLAPQLSFSLSDRAVYSHLLRHSRLEGKLQFQFSIPWLAHGVGVTSKTARDAVRRLIARGVLHLVERNTQAHHVVRLRLPSEVRAVRAAKIAPYRGRTPRHTPLSTSRRRISCECGPCARPSTPARTAAAFIVCAQSHVKGGASTTLCRVRNPAAIPTATSFLVVSIAIPKRRSTTPSSLYARSTATAA